MGDIGRGSAGSSSPRLGETQKTRWEASGGGVFILAEKSATADDDISDEA